jgi:hypothetical protein
MRIPLVGMPNPQAMIRLEVALHLLVTILLAATSKSVRSGRSYASR